MQKRVNAHNVSVLKTAFHCHIVIRIVLNKCSSLIPFLSPQGRGTNNRRKFHQLQSLPEKSEETTIDESLLLNSEEITIDKSSYSPHFFASCQGEAHLEKQPIAMENEQPNLTKNLMSVIEPIDLEKEKNKLDEVSSGDAGTNPVAP